MNNINSSGATQRAIAVVGDVTNQTYIDRLVKQAAEFGNGKIHIIINNAGFTWDAVIHKVWDISNLLNSLVECWAVCSIQSFLPQEKQREKRNLFWRHWYWYWQKRILILPYRCPINNGKRCCWYITLDPLSSSELLLLTSGWKIKSLEWSSILAVPVVFMATRKFLPIFVKLFPRIYYYHPSIITYTELLN